MDSKITRRESVKQGREEGGRRGRRQGEENRHSISVYGRGISRVHDNILMVVATMTYDDLMHPCVHVPYISLLKCFRRRKLNS